MPGYGDTELEATASYVIFKIKRLSFWFSQLAIDDRFISAAWPPARSGVTTLFGVAGNQSSQKI